MLDSDFTTDIDPNGLTVAGGGGIGTFEVRFNPSTEGVHETLLTLEQLVDGSIGATTGLINEAGQTVQGIDLSGTGSPTDPTGQPGAQGCDIVGTPQGETLTGTSNPETICGLGGGDKINGLGNNDILKGDSGNNRISDKKGKARGIQLPNRKPYREHCHEPGDLFHQGFTYQSAV